MLAQVDIEVWSKDEEGNPVIAHQSLLENIERVITYSTLEYDGVPEDSEGFFYEVVITKGMVEVNQFDETGEFLKGGILPLSNHPVSLSNTFIEKEK